MKKQNEEDILKRYLKKQATKEEVNLIESWYNIEAESANKKVAPEKLEGIGSSIFKMLPAKRGRIITWRQVSVAATILLVLGIGGILLHNNLQSPPQQLAQDIMPGKFGATLKLAEGKSIQLNEENQGTLFSSNSLNVSKTDSNQVVFSGNTSSTENQPNMNMLETSRGQEYQLVLADGTKVWLNSATILKFPDSFEGAAKRSVELSGEAYFEVAKNPDQPFIVISQGQTVEVLGTHFNVNAYNNEAAAKTTLVEGVVRVSSIQGESLDLEPGQQSVLSMQQLTLAENPDIEAAISWKNGYFKFNESLQEIMRKIATWYDVEVVYPENFDNSEIFVGKISRSQNISSILEIMQQTGKVNFEINERRIIVMQ